MTLTKTLRGLVERAERNGVSIKRVREGAVMGSGYGWGSNPKDTPMVEQWKVTYEQVLHTDGSTSRHYRVYHYGTLIFYANNVYAGGYFLQDYYGESNSDRDAINGMCEYLRIDRSFRYGSRIGFIEA